MAMEDMVAVQQCPSEDEHRSCNRAPWSCLCFCRGWLSQRWLWWIWLWRMNTVLAIVLLGAAYASAEAGYLRGGYGGYGYGRGYYGKREADAVAEAEPGYSRGYGGYGYGGYSGYGRGYYGKREADAEPGYYSRGYGSGVVAWLSISLPLSIVATIVAWFSISLPLSIVATSVATNLHIHNLWSSSLAQHQPPSFRSSHVHSH